MDPNEQFWMIVNMCTARRKKGMPVGFVSNPELRPKCIYYEKERALFDLAELKERYPNGRFYLLEAVAPS